MVDWKSYGITQSAMSHTHLTKMHSWTVQGKVFCVAIKDAGNERTLLMYI